MCVNTSSGTWQQALRGEPGIAMSVMAHEHYHSMQEQLGCLLSPWRKDYQWWIEGSTSYIGWETAVASGDLDRAWWIRCSKTCAPMEISVRWHRTSVASTATQRMRWATKRSSS